MTDQTHSSQAPLLELKDLRMYFAGRKSGSFFAPKIEYLKAVDGISFTIQPGETLGLVGESGCGKSTIGFSIVRSYQPTGGQILYRTRQNQVVDLAKLKYRELIPYRKELRMIFQDPYSSLNPRMTVMDIVADPLLVHHVAHGKELEDRVAALLKRVGLRPEYMRRYPHAFSGGQRQRIGIARALALEPRLVVADEAVSALDVSVQAQILNLMRELQKEFNLTYLFISHALSVVEYMADRVAVMYVGKLVETADTPTLFAMPGHPYTEALLSAVPKPDPHIRMKRILLEGEVPDPTHPPSGCYFHPRCHYAQAICQQE
jgi:peptide/nickel transport system ATP-binding protein